MTDETIQPMSSKIFLDEVERLHYRQDKLGVRVARLEEQVRNGAGSDPMSQIMMWMAVAYLVSAVAPLLIDMVENLRRRKPSCEE